MIKTIPMIVSWVSDKSLKGEGDEKPSQTKKMVNNIKTRKRKSLPSGIVWPRNFISIINKVKEIILE